MINFKNIEAISNQYLSMKPFPHIVVDDFFNYKIAKKLEKEFPNFDDKIWHEYSNKIENKKTLNNWNYFPELTYSVFNTLVSNDFADRLSKTLYNHSILFGDPGLNGGGWHIHNKGGDLNTHLDYSLHPKLKKQRKVNIIIYLNSNWRNEWGGQLGLWSNESNIRPGKLCKKISAKYNRAIIFDTTFNSWHGLPQPIQCPQNEYRKSLAVYYLCEASKTTDPRGRALFAPRDNQKNDKEILSLIKRRSDINYANKVYKK
ncbi:MAG: hypothetical protein CBB97_16195 [Candidatus Endolissoclinum sp. TMED37]|nr:MAG: hypothetical protein CBB97_16195 [Candidatus Endolissoclinum sp. TMED37]|tara:strand:- start:2319 stop:3095 length:777 start_codon:yes stop_codon:yes gene_type:complete